VERALELYQERLRKPSLTIYCLDFSGSMAGEGKMQLTEALRNLLDEETAKKNLLSATEKDEHVFVLFNSDVIGIIGVSGNDPRELLDVYHRILAVKPGGGTDIYIPVLKCFDIIRQYNIKDYTSAIILMTDGESEDRYQEFFFGNYRNYLDKLDVPVFSIMFGNAKPEQLDALAELTRARVFDGKTDLVTAFKNAKGYN
jgi:Ca-activated chloride channel family protein